MKIRSNINILLIVLIQYATVHGSDESRIPFTKKNIQISDQEFNKAKQNDNDIVIFHIFSERLHNLCNTTNGMLDGENLEKVKNFWAQIKPYLIRKMEDNEEILCDIYGLTITFNGILASKHNDSIKLHRDLAKPTIFNTLNKILLALTKKFTTQEHKYPCNIFPTLTRDLEKI